MHELRIVKVVPAIFWLLLSLLIPPGQAAVRETSGNRDRSIVELLDQIAGNADSQANIFLNDARVADFRKKLSAEKDPVQQMVLRVFLAWELVFAGRTEPAIQEAEEVLAQARALKAPEDAPVMRDLKNLIAVSFLRLGEQENCLNQHSAESCLMPLRKNAVHQRPRGSRTAIEHLTGLLEEDPEDLGHRWLLNLAYMTLGEYPEGVPSRWRLSPTIFDSDRRLPRFENVAPSVGVATVGLAGGSIVDDFDGDGFLDIVVSSWGLRDQLRYFHNSGDGSFDDWTARAGLLGQVGGLNILQGDYNNDEFVDILVLRGGWLGFLGPSLGDHPDSLLRNNGDGTFTDVTREAGLFARHPTQTAAWADYDLDGDLDLFLAVESDGQHPANRRPCLLFENRGDGTFGEIARQVGLDHVGFVKGVTWGDFDNDGFPDLYLSRFGQKNVLFHNDGRDGSGWRFTDVTNKAGVAEPILSFPTWFWDYDNDGWQDILVASFSSYSEDSLGTIVEDYLGQSDGETSRLYRNRGDGTFEDVTRKARMDAVLMAMGANFGDIDNDGFLDAYFGTGQPRISTLVPNRMFRNSAGRRFEDVTTSGGFGHLQKGHGISFGDLDNDGDQDVYAVFGGAYSGDIYQNALFLNPGNENGWLTLELRGSVANRLGLGARIKVVVRSVEGLGEIHRTVSSGGSFGASPMRQLIGLGQADAIEQLEISWPSPGQPKQVFREVPMNKVLRVRQGSESFEILKLRRLDLGPRLKSSEAPGH